jgi:hypothetical protein
MSPNALPLRRIEEHTLAPMPRGSWPATVPAVRRLLDAGLELGPVNLSTHSPVLAAMDGATIRELGEWGIRQSSWEDLELVRSRRSLLDAPERFLRHLRPAP